MLGSQSLRSILEYPAGGVNIFWLIFFLWKNVEK